MVKLAPLAETKQLLNIIESDFDAKIEKLIDMCSAVILRYLKADPSDATGLENDEDVKVACIIFVGILLREPDGDAEALFDRHYTLPTMVQSLLMERRPPTIV